MIVRRFTGLAAPGWFDSYRCWLGNVSDKERAWIEANIGPYNAVCGGPAAPAIPIYVGPAQTPDEVIAATRAATDAQQRAQAEQQAADAWLDLPEWANPVAPSPSPDHTLLYLALAVGAAGVVWGGLQ